MTTIPFILLFAVASLADPLSLNSPNTVLTLNRTKTTTFQVPVQRGYLPLRNGKTIFFEKLLLSSVPDSRAIIYIYGFQQSSLTGSEGIKVDALRELCVLNQINFIR